METGATAVRQRLQATLGGTYTLERELEGGAMSRVFVATETALGRRVVVKVLPPDMAETVSAERFRREIRLAARLQHPAIVPLLSAGEAGGSPPEGGAPPDSGGGRLLYYTMPFVEGESLRQHLAREGELPVAEGVRVLREVARALAYAHARGVIHRDIKPENILLGEDAVLVADFGVAKALSAAADEVGAVTSAGVALGTPAYMAPEQLAADPQTDHRADLYALGVVAYEILAGAHPFAGRPAQALLAAHATEPPEPITRRRPNLPPTLAALVMRLLEKRPADRPQSAEEVLRALEAVSISGSGASAVSHPARLSRRLVAARVGTAMLVLAIVAGAAYVALRGRVQAPPGRGEQAAADGAAKSVAVLPFVNVGGRPEEEYFADGMTDELAGALGTVPGLRVASRTSSFAFKGKSEDVREIGRRLHVGSVLEGSVRREGRRLRVRAQLTDVADGLALWSDTYEREERDVFQVQEEIARAIAGALRVRLAGHERLVRGGTSNLEAHDLYLRGRFFALKFTEPDLRRALELYQQALARDSTYAPAWAGVADAWTYLADDWVAPREAYPKAKVAVRTALALDSTLAEAHAVLGITLCYMWDATRGERELRRGLALNPNLAGVWSWYGDVLLWRGAFDSAVVAHRRAIALDPLDAYYVGQLAWTLIWAGRIDEAIAAARKAFELDPHYALAYIRLGYAQLAAGDPAAALEALRRAPEFSDRAQAGIVVALAELGRTTEARRLLADIEREAERRYVRGEGIAWAYLALGDRERAFQWLERAYADRSAGLIYAERDPRWAPIRDDPRFVALLRKMRPW